MSYLKTARISYKTQDASSALLNSRSPPFLKPKDTIPSSDPLHYALAPDTTHVRLFNVLHHHIMNTIVVSFPTSSIHRSEEWHTSEQ
ncbi:hypothetical protein M422DRAFT_39688 [Sphaerobolus stellatus SS14]|uniref:Uncharacterized protein n=1 Tax=Sphaerobolus stellatus (strain SS14) TaxID=990650 RepID=A0A0C9U2J1_SPHS4|nr:hypothetical protein M422DRAFT_39688 [Sphaerobolus stellatus SS14]